MPEEDTTPDLAELTRRQFEAVNRRDMDALVRRCTPDAVYDTSPDGMGLHEGPAAIGAFAEGWWGAFEDLVLEPEDVLDSATDSCSRSFGREAVQRTAQAMCNDAKRTSCNG
jgi:ketosteroid isomerase-like protein